MDDDEIRSLVTRLSRPHPSGGRVIERAAIFAEGADFDAVMAWISKHGGEAEAVVPTATRHGLHGSRLHDSGGSTPQTPSRFILPPGALDRPPSAGAQPPPPDSQSS
ncbi:MAG: hypothetical protein H0U79_02390 [Solirubrobacterales bacterium]|nr:hypothetical protein [Solirubrobacterales bacterium]